MKSFLGNNILKGLGYVAVELLRFPATHNTLCAKSTMQTHVVTLCCVQTQSVYVLYLPL